MSPRWRRAITASGTLAAILALLAQIAVLPAPGLGSSDATPLPRPPFEAHKLDPVESYAAIADRPLFQPSRRPAIPPKPAAPAGAVAAAPRPLPPPPPPAPPPVLPAITLLAVVISADKREAVLGLAGNKAATLAEGESLEGWVLARVLPDRVVFRLADIATEIAFPTARNPARPALPGRPANPSPPIQRPH